LMPGTIHRVGNRRLRLMDPLTSRCRARGPA
jgi:hypothetical protein